MENGQRNGAVGQNTPTPTPSPSMYAGAGVGAMAVAVATVDVVAVVPVAVLAAAGLGKGMLLQCLRWCTRTAPRPGSGSVISPAVFLRQLLITGTSMLTHSTLKPQACTNTVRGNAVTKAARKFQNVQFRKWWWSVIAQTTIAQTPIARS